MMKHNQFSKLFSIITIFTCLPLLASIPAASVSSINDASQNSTNRISLGDRPAKIQEKIDLAFEALQLQTREWSCGGKKGSYQLMGLVDAQVIRDVIVRSDNKKDIYLIDVGAGAGAWGEAAVKLLKKEFHDKAQHFHVISLSGANELKDDSIVTENNITHYRMGKFKIENVDTELQKRGLDLTNKVDLIVTSWTLTHLVDPIGTLKQLYQLLSPHHGTILGNNFLHDFYLNNAEKAATTYFSDELWKLLAHLPAKSLFCSRSSEVLGNFILIRQDERPFDLPIDYTEERLAFKSEMVLSERATFQQEINSNITHEYTTYYGNEKSKELFDELIQRGLIVPHATASK